MKYNEVISLVTLLVTYHGHCLQLSVFITRECTTNFIIEIFCYAFSFFVYAIMYHTFWIKMKTVSKLILRRQPQKDLYTSFDEYCNISITQ